MHHASLEPSPLAAGSGGDAAVALALVEGFAAGTDLPLLGKKA